MDSRTWRHDADVHSCISSIDEILDTGIIGMATAGTPLFWAAITVILINLRDLLAKADGAGKRVNITTDVLLGNGVNDLTDLIVKCRDAVCHVTSRNHDIDKMNSIVVKRGIAIGHAPNLIQVGDLILGSDYADDIALTFGPYRLYVKRNLLAAYEAAKAALLR